MEKTKTIESMILGALLGVLLVTIGYVLISASEDRQVKLDNIAECIDKEMIDDNFTGSFQDGWERYSKFCI